MELFTIGVYGKSEAEFFRTLTAAGVDTFCDVRNRRGMRGPQYAFVNSVRLQEKLASLGIRYYHLKELAPSDSTRKAQKDQDGAIGTTKRSRVTLGEEFRKLYRSECLRSLRPSKFVERLKAEDRKVVLFCVESAPDACHRSLLAEYLAVELCLPVTHL